MKNILVPIDFSQVSKNALTFAVKVAQIQNSKIILYHSDQPLFIANDMGAFVYEDLEYERDLKVINEKMDELAIYIDRHDVLCKKVIHRSILKDDVLNVVEKESIDLIVTGTNGAKGLNSFFFGTNSFAIFEKVKCPVLMIPAGARYTGINKIMYATDFKFGDIEAIKEVCNLAAVFDASVFITHINTDVEKFNREEDALDWFAETGIDKLSYNKISFRLIHDNDIFEGLNRTIIKLGINILCMSRNKKSFWQELISKSNTKEMAYHTNIPLLAIHLSE